MLSVIIPCKNEEGNILNIHNKLSEALSNVKYELIFIDDGSTDKTMEKLEEIYNVDKEHVRAISFSRNFKKDAAIYAGLENCSGDYACIIDGDLQQNPKYLLEMYNFLESNPEYDEVAMIQKERKTDNFIMRLCKRFFYYLIDSMSETHFENGASDFRMFRRNVIDAVIELGEKNRFTKGIFSWIGFNTEYMYYNVEKRYSGKTKFNTKNQINYALTGITNFSIKPLSLATTLGIIISILALIYIIITITQVLLFGKDVPGYASLLTVTLFLGGLQLIFLGIIGTYLGKNYIESKNRPIYIEKETKGFDEIL